MHFRQIARVLLLAFVAASLGYTAWKEVRGEGLPEGIAAEDPRASGTVAQNGTEPVPQAPRRLVAYYFHGTKRCNTCRAIEAQAREALESGFPEALLAGRLEWREVNVDQPGNDRFVKEYELTGSTLVLVEIRDGAPVRFKRLGKVWDLVADRPAFQDYVQQETRAWLEEGS